MPANHTEVEKRLWDAADELRANSKLKSSEYSVPVLGLIFLRYADHKFTEAEKKLSGGGGGRRKIGKTDYQAQGVLYIPEKARFASLLNLPEGADIGKAINEGMKAIEAENEDLKDILPKTYNALEKGLLVSLLKNFSAIPITEGDAFGKIYEYFLGKFAMAEGQKGGEFFIVHSGLAGKSPRINRKKFHRVIDLYFDGADQNVEIRFQNIEEKIIAKLRPETKDLLEVAAALYVADTSISRGQTDVYGRDWQRRIRFVLPVRRVKQWRKVAPQLSELTTYLSGDASITFDFKKHKQNDKGQGYLEFPPAAPGFQGADRIVLFSGGLDSLAGVANVLAGGEVPLLISHRSSPTRTQLQESLPERLRQKTGKRLPLIYAWITRKGAEASDNTQRLRSFLYMSLAAIAAKELSIDKIAFCENGITTFNLPLSDQRVGTRSTRTTHPRVVSMFVRMIETLWNGDVGVGIFPEREELLLLDRVADIQATV